MLTKNIHILLAIKIKKNILIPDPGLLHFEKYESKCLLNYQSTILFQINHLLEIPQLII